LKRPCYDFTQELDSFEKNLASIEKLYSDFLSKSNNNGIVELYLHADVKSKYPILSNLAGNMLALPNSSGEIERLFSQLKLIKSDRKCSLSEATLESLILFKTSEINIENHNIYKRVVENQILMRVKLAQFKKESLEQSKKRKIGDVQKDNDQISQESQCETFEALLEKRLKKLKLDEEEKYQSKVRHRIFDDEYYL